MIRFVQNMGTVGYVCYSMGFWEWVGVLTLKHDEIAQPYLIQPPESPASQHHELKLQGIQIYESKKAWSNTADQQNLRVTYIFKLISETTVPRFRRGSRKE